MGSIGTLAFAESSIGVQRTIALAARICAPVINSGSRF
jgi:hypothetical protein